MSIYKSTFQEKVIRLKMPITNILISRRGLSSNSANASLVFHGQEYDLSAYMNQQGGGDININISDRGVLRIVSKKKREYFQNAPVPKKQQHLLQTVPVAEDEQHFQTVPVAEVQQEHLQTVPVAEQQHYQAVTGAEAEQQNHFQTGLEAEKQQHLWSVPVAIAGVVIVGFLYFRWK